MFKFKVCDSLTEVSHLIQTEPMFCDTETDGLYINCRLLQVYQPAVDPVIYILDTDIIPLDDIKEWFKPMWSVWYNSAYDCGTLNMTTDVVDDLFYLVKSAYPQFGVLSNKPYTLDKTVVNLGLGNLYEGLDKKALQKQGFVKGAYLSQTQLEYSATDVYALSLIWKKERIQEERNSPAYKVDMLSLKYCIEYQQNGILVDEKLRLQYEDKAKANIDRLRPLLPAGFNPNSWQQVRKLLNSTKSDHEALVRIALKGNEYAQIIIDIKRSIKEYRYLQSIKYDKMITRYNPAGAITGRFTASGGDIPNGFNSQQMPRQLQPIFQQDTEDTAVVHLDYSTLELRVACAVFGEDTMYQQLQNGEDLHTATAMAVTGRPLHPDGLLGEDYLSITDTSEHSGKYLTKKDRQDAKAVNFGFVFGMSAKRYVDYAYTQYGIIVTEEEAVNIRNAYFKKYPKFKEYHNMVWNNYQKPGYYYVTALGRRVKPKLGTDGINGPVQGSGAETTKLAVHYLCRQYPEALKYIYNVVHDAIYLRVPKEDKQIWFDRTREAMLKGWEEISKSPLFVYKDIPIDAGE